MSSLRMLIWLDGGAGSR